MFFDGERVARHDGVNGAGGVFYYFSDHLKTASVVTDSAGTIKAESDYYPWGGELQLTANDLNHYKFTGKERDGETGLDYFGARYYSNALGRFLTPDWAGKAAAVPYAEFTDPQSLNLYTYVRNLPTSKIDTDGHCAGDNCSDITVNIKVTSDPAFRENEEQLPDKTFQTGVRGQMTVTFKQNGKPMKNVPVKEAVKAKTTKNGVVVSKNPGANPNPVRTDAAGQIKDDVGLQLTTNKPVSQATADAIRSDQTTNAFTMQATQTLTFPGANGATCSVTDQRTLTNVDSNGNLNTKTDSTGSNYTVTESPKNPKVTEQR